MSGLIKKLATAVAVSAALGSSPASAYFVGSTDVGALDIVRGYTTQADLGGSDPATETAWVNSVLGTNFAGTSNSATTSISAVEGSPTIYAFSLPAPTPGYYIVKNSTRFLLLENLSSFDWGVFSWAGTFNGTPYDLNGNGSNYEQVSISHYAKFGSTTTTQVPEPGALGLMGLGLLGVAGLSRRRLSKSKQA